MKKAYSYIRISTKDQSNFSIEGQKEVNQRYASSNNIIILDEFVDDGYSAKNFDRPNWQELYQELRTHKNYISFLLVAKYDRLVRNAAEGLAMLKKIEEEYGIKVISTTECFFIDPHSPVFFKFRADLFVNAEFEYRVIRDRTKFGNWQARSNGRYITTAPLGYDNKRDENNKPIIVLNDDAPKVKEAFHLFMKGFSYGQIRNICRINRSGKSSIKWILLNPTYAGLIKVKAYRDHPEQLVKGIHEPIVSEELYWSVYNKIMNSNPAQKSTPTEKIPLRGYLQCTDCLKKVTAAESSGNGGKYIYYRCLKCSRKSVNANKVHNWVNNILEELSFSVPIDYWNHYFIDEASAIMSRKNKKLHDLNKRLDSLEKSIDQLEEKFIQNEIESDVYKKWKAKYVDEKYNIELDIESSKKLQLTKSEGIREALNQLKNLTTIYDNLQAPEKQELLSTIMIGGLYMDKNYLQTIRLNPLFDHKNLNIKCFRINKIGNIKPIFPKSPIGSGGRT